VSRGDEEICDSHGGGWGRHDSFAQSQYGAITKEMDNGKIGRAMGVKLGNA